MTKFELVKRAQKHEYLDGAELGVLVAFRTDAGRVLSAKMIRRSKNAKKIMVRTQYGAEYIVTYDNVLWVRTGTKWPIGVLKELKGSSFRDDYHEIKARMREKEKIKYEEYEKEGLQEAYS